MDIPSLSIGMHTSQVMNEFSIKMLDKSLDQLQQTGDGMMKVLEASVTPNLGQNFDMQV
ncbi:MAG: YjfB family protein [Lachnospiraceae bacterium]|nr:YjfB family protein [Lachnospiraceae bacterium]